MIITILEIFFIAGICLESGPIGWVIGIILAIGWYHAIKNPSERDPLPPDVPSNVKSQYNNLDFNSYEWEKTWDGKLTNIFNGTTFTRDCYGNWEADDDNGSGESEEYGWYEVKDW